jgi:hypothetical protein
MRTWARRPKANAAISRSRGSEASEVEPPHVTQREPESTHHILKCKKPKLALGTLVAVLTLDWLFTAI